MINEISNFNCLLKKSFQEDYDEIQKSNYLRIIFLLKLFFFTYPFDTRLRSFCYRVFHNYGTPRIFLQSHPTYPFAIRSGFSPLQVDSPVKALSHIW